MKSSHLNALRNLDRFNLRLPPEMVEKIDMARGRRAGNVSRNTWIAEAIYERLVKEFEENKQKEVNKE